MDTEESNEKGGPIRIDKSLLLSPGFSEASAALGKAKKLTGGDIWRIAKLNRLIIDQSKTREEAVEMLTERYHGKQEQNEQGQTFIRIGADVDDAAERQEMIEGYNRDTKEMLKGDVATPFDKKLVLKGKHGVDPVHLAFLLDLVDYEEDDDAEGKD